MHDAGTQVIIIIIIIIIIITSVQQVTAITHTIQLHNFPCK